MANVYLHPNASILSTFQGNFASPTFSKKPSENPHNEAISNVFKLVRLDQAVVNAVGDFSKKHQIELLFSSIFWGMTIITAQVLGVAFAVYLFTLDIIGIFAFSNFINSQKDHFDRLDNKYFLLSASARNIFIGALLTIPVITITANIENICNLIMQQFGLAIDFYQDVAVLIVQPGIIGLIMIIFACILAPITEEILFRGYINDFLLLHEHDKRMKLPPQSDLPSITDIKENKAFHTWDKFKTILKVSLLFGLAHLSPFQGWANILVFAVTTCMSLMLSLITEYTGDLWAATTIHMLNNIRSTLLLRMGG